MNAALRAWRGFVRPFELLALLWAQPVARRQWLKLVVTQVSLTVVLGSVMFVRDLEQEREKEHERSPEVKRARRAQQEQALHGLEAKLRDAGLDTALEQLAGADDVKRVLRELIDDATDGGVSDEAIGEKLAQLKEALEDDAPGTVEPEAGSDDDDDDDAPAEGLDGGAQHTDPRTTGAAPGTKKTFERELASGLRAALEAALHARRDGGVVARATGRGHAQKVGAPETEPTLSEPAVRVALDERLADGHATKVVGSAAARTDGAPASRAALDGGSADGGHTTKALGHGGAGAALTAKVGGSERADGVPALRAALDGGSADGGHATKVLGRGDAGAALTAKVGGSERADGAPALRAALDGGSADGGHGTKVLGHGDVGAALTGKVGGSERADGAPASRAALDGSVDSGARPKEVDRSTERVESASALRSALGDGEKPERGDRRVGDGGPGARSAKAIAPATEHGPALRAALDGGVAGGISVPDDDDEETPAPDSRPLWYRRLVLWASSLVLVQSVLLAFTRDHQDRVAYHLSLLAGVQPEDVPGELKLRLDLKWLWRKLRRRIRGALVLAAGVATLLPVLFVALVLGQKDLVFTAVVSVVSGYWWVVFTAARSARAWRGEDDPTPPRPLRFALELSRRWKWLRWFGVPWLVRFAVWASKSMAAPARNIERDLPRFVGLALARVVATLPVVRLVLRAPLIVAAGEALEATADPEVQPVVPGEPDLPPPT